MALQDDYANRLNAASNKIAQELKSARDQILAAVSQNDANVQTKVADALSVLNGPISALEQMGVDNQDAFPGPAQPGPIPAPSDVQLDNGADPDPNAPVDNGGVGPVAVPVSADQVNTSLDGNAPHTQPDGTFTGSVAPVEQDVVPAAEPVVADGSDSGDSSSAKSASAKSSKGK